MCVLGEERLQSDRPGAGIDLIVDGEQCSGGEFLFLLPVICLDGELTYLKLGEHRRQAVLGDGEEHRGRLQLGDQHQTGRVGGMDDVPRVHLAQSHAPPHRSDDPAVGELQAGGVDLSLVDLDSTLVLAHQGVLGVQLLLRDGVLRPELPVALQIDPGVSLQFGVACLLPLSLGQLHLEGTRVDDGEEVAAFHGLPLPEADLHKLAVHP